MGSCERAEVPVIIEAEQINSPQEGENINTTKKQNKKNRKPTTTETKYTVAHKLKYYAFLIW